MLRIPNFIDLSAKSRQELRFLYEEINRLETELQDFKSKVSSLNVQVSQTSNDLANQLLGPLAQPLIGDTGTDLAGVGVGNGTVTSIGLVVPAIFTLSGSPVTTSGNITIALNSQAANLGLFSPNGGAGVPAFRSLVLADLPVTIARGNGVEDVTGAPNINTGKTTLTLNGVSLNVMTCA